MVAVSNVNMSREKRLLIYHYGSFLTPVIIFRHSSSFFCFVVFFRFLPFIFQYFYLLSPFYQFCFFLFLTENISYFLYLNDFDHLTQLFPSCSQNQLDYVFEENSPISSRQDSKPQREI